MGSRQRPSGHTTSDAGGRQAGAGRNAARERELVADQRRHEDEALSSARGGLEENLPSDEPAADAPAQR